MCALVVFWGASTSALSPPIRPRIDINHHVQGDVRLAAGLQQGRENCMGSDMNAMFRIRHLAIITELGCLASVTVACAERQTRQADAEEEPIARAELPVFVNGSFEAGAADVAPPDWVVTTYRNPGVTYPPTSLAQLNLGTGGSARTFTLESLAGPETQPDPDLGTSASLRWPRYGNKVAIVNQRTAGRNVNAMRQTMTIGAGDIDSVDGMAHVRFVVAPVLENPAGHDPNEQPYYWVRLNNLTKSTVLYQDFNASAQPGVPWKLVSANGYAYTDWQLVDIAPGNAALAIGDQVELEVIAAACSLGGHWGQVYVDGVGSTIPGIFVKATGPNAQNAGSDITYTLNYQNGGSTSAGNVRVDFNTPPNTTWVGLNAPGLTCTTPAAGATGLTTCTIGTLGAGSGGNLQVTVRINPAATGTITNGNYSIYATNVSPLLGPKVYTNITSGIAYADLAMTMSNGVAGIAWEQPVSYTIVARNNGPSAVTGATVTNTIPAQLTGATWTCVAAGGAVCPASGSDNINANVNLPVGATATFTLNANVVAGTGTSSVTNLATITLPASASDTDTTNNSAVDTDAIGELRTITLTKTGSGLGTISSVPSAISCGGSCTSATGAFLQGSTVVLNAVAGVGDAFTTWGGACAASGSTPTCTLTMNGNHNVTATFTALPKPNGAACLDNSGCTSNNCIDGYCCNTSCGGGVATDCQACNVVGNQGTCSPVPAGATCRVSAGICDVAESCNGSDTACPADGFLPNTTQCRADSGGGCDVAEFCTGTGANCPADGFVAAETQCRGAAGVCDAVEVCTGTSGTCPDDALLPNTTECRANSGGGCDVAEFCTGLDVNCPNDAFVAADTQCRAASCSGTTATLAASCTGSAAACPDVQTTSCGTFICGASTCLALCESDLQCALGNYCAAGACLPKLTLGGACTANNMCASDHCVDGVCCDTACSGQCEACDVETSVGTCTAVSGAPHGEIRSQCAGVGTTCGGTCGGTDRTACTYPTVTTECRAASCADGVATLAAGCNGEGTCPTLQTQACSPYQCGTTQCLGDCEIDAQCAAGNYCSAGLCVPKLDNGTACGGNNQCTSANCVDGVCCNTSCTEQCEACNIEGSLGTCSPVTGAPRGTRPACATDGSSCAGACDGSDRVACAYPTSVCRSAACASGTATLEARCDGAGSCPDLQTQACAPYLCGATACAGNCTIDAECTATHYCSAGVCTEKLGIGVSCSEQTQCASTHCVDGVCCDNACTGQCEACDAQGTLGTCSPVTGAPHGARMACSTDGSLCGGACNGTTRDACVYPGESTSCRAASCTDGAATMAAGCDGAGACPAPSQVACGAFACGATACIGNCTQDSDCAAGNYCAAGVCTPKQAIGATCSGDTQCTSGFCVDGVCCNSACQGQCQACDITGSTGTCAVTTGAPHGNRPGCSGEGTCAGSCDGVIPNACSYPGTNRACVPASCTAGVARSVAVCDGEGSCGASTETKCAPYTCSGQVCGSTCVTAANCATGKICTSGACVDPPTGTGGSAGAAGASGSSSVATGGVTTSSVATGGVATGGVATSTITASGTGATVSGGTSSVGGSQSPTATSKTAPRDDGVNLEGGGCNCRATARSSSLGYGGVFALTLALVLSTTRRRHRSGRAA